MRKFLAKLFGTPKGRTIVNAICAGLWVYCAFTAVTPLMSGLSALNAALFGMIAGQNLHELHFRTILELKDEHIAFQDNVINRLYGEVDLLIEEKSA